MTLGRWPGMSIDDARQHVARLNASLPIIGKSLGHASQQATAIYARLNLDPVRAAMEKATDAMMGCTVRGGAGIRLVKRKEG
ncbi:MAG: hypothetical protein H7836_02270 [Magnetococcus sp. YQC-3]